MKMDTDQSREYLIAYMGKYFTDATFTNYIRTRLAGDFAYQMANALAAQGQPEALRAALVRLMDSDKGIAAATDEDLAGAATDPDCDRVVKEQAAAVAQARTALKGIAAPEQAQSVAFRSALNDLLHQIDIGDFTDSHGHSAKMLKPVQDAMALLAQAPASDALDAARAKGRAEALAILTQLDAEGGIDAYTGWSTPVSPEDEGSAYWDLPKLRELLHVDTVLADMKDAAEAEYWSYVGLRDEAERIHAAALIAHEELRDEVGQAINDAIATGAPSPDWCDSREIDRLADAAMLVLLTRSSHGQHERQKSVMEGERLNWVIEQAGLITQPHGRNFYAVNIVFDQAGEIDLDDKQKECRAAIDAAIAAREEQK